MRLFAFQNTDQYKRLTTSPFIRYNARLLTRRVRNYIGQEGNEYLDRRQSNSSLTLHRANSKGLIRLLRLLSRNTSDNTIPVPTSYRFNGNSCGLPIKRTRLLLTRVLKSMLCEDLICGIGMNFRLQRPCPKPLFRRLRRKRPFERLTKAHSVFLFLRFGGLFNRCYYLSPTPLCGEGNVVRIVLGDDV